MLCPGPYHHNLCRLLDFSFPVIPTGTQDITPVTTFRLKYFKPLVTATGASSHRATPLTQKALITAPDTLCVSHAALCVAGCHRYLPCLGAYPVFPSAAWQTTFHRTHSMSNVSQDITARVHTFTVIQTACLCDMDM